MNARARAPSWLGALTIAVGASAVHALLLVGSAILLAEVVPTFAAMFAELGSSLPTPTILTLDLSDSLRRAWFLWLPAMALGLTINTAFLALLARMRGIAWSLVAGVLQSLPLLLLPLLIGGSLYLPIFAISAMIE